MEGEDEELRKHDNEEEQIHILQLNDSRYTLLRVCLDLTMFKKFDYKSRVVLKLNFNRRNKKVRILNNLIIKYQIVVFKH
jgi:hypothetical protein